MAEALLRKFRPTASNPWDYAKAAHLLNRAGFGGRPEEVERLVALGAEGAVDELLNYNRIPEEVAGVDFSALYQLYEEAARLVQSGADQNTRLALANRINRARREKFQEVREWWVGRMLQTKRPLQETMVLFWHGLLVSGFPEVNNPRFLYMQNELFRRMALGNFKELILEISKDPAMLVYLDNRSNRKGRPNENYARELLELFTLGIGNYTEQDIKEAAHAFTGWTLRGTEFFFNRAQHDEGQKTFLGKTGNLDGTDIINIIFEQSAAARWLPRKLFEFFVYLKPDEAIIQDLAGLFTRTIFDVKAVVQTLLGSQAFYSPAAMHAQVKSPVSLVVGTARALALPPQSVRVFVLVMDKMGQALLHPPNVGGWPKGQGWITTSTILDRYNFAGLLTSGRMPGIPRSVMQGMPIGIDGLAPASATTAGDMTGTLLRRLLPGVTLDQKRMFGLWRVVGANRPTDPIQVTAQRVRSAVHLIMSMPEYQLT